jgi:hypothetical protein
MPSGLKYINASKTVPHDVNNITGAGAQFPPNIGHYSVTCEYHNGFSKAVTIVNREGLKVEIPPGINPQLRDFIIRYRLTLGRDVILNIDALFDSQSSSSKMLAKLIQEGDLHFRYGQKVYTLDYHLDLNEIESKGGSLYLTTLDTVVTTLTGPLIPYHPYSEVYLRHVAVEENPHINEVESFGYSIRIYDSVGHYGVRYVNINNQIYKIPTTVSQTLPDGVYFSSSGPVAGDYNLAKPVSKRYSFKEADAALRLYKSVEEAQAFGDEFAEREKSLKLLALQIKEREQKLKEEKLNREAEFDNFKQKLEQQRFEEEALRKQEEARSAQRLNQLKEEIAQLEHQRTIEMLQKKDHYEYRSLERKESGEVVKFLPTLITGALAIFLAVSKFSN